MEKFYEVTDESKIKEEYLLYKENSEKIREVYKKFKKRHGIEASSYYPTTSNLYIIPTENDIKNFGNQLTKKDEGEGLRRFRANSRINKAWVRILEKLSLEVLHKPLLGFYFNIVGRHRTRIFSVDDKVYCSLQSEHEFKTPKGLEEIKASEFFKIIEDYNESLKEEC
jgi:hypothetical protein|nr:MAG TPA: hypothetical protein [Caudoviricetes sp.]